jgi:hypothetical protein
VLAHLYLLAGALRKCTTRPGQPAQQGLYAVAASIPAGDIGHRRNLVTHALIRMAMDWGYLDGAAVIARLSSA